MAKRKIVPSSSEDDSSAGRGKEVKAASPDRKAEKGAVKGKSPKKEKSEKKDKKDKKDKDKKAKKDEKADKKDEKAKKDEQAEKQKEQAEPDKKDKKADKKDKKAAKGKTPTKEIVFSVKEVYKAASKPFGMELDGALVVDIMDKDSAACSAGVQIGWYVESVNWQAVPQEDEKVATKVLRDAEVAAAKDGKPVRVVFTTEEPEHWKAALKKLRGPEGK